jgi:hypothetical protein
MVLLRTRPVTRVSECTLQLHHTLPHVNAPHQTPCSPTQAARPSRHYTHTTQQHTRPDSPQ